MARREQTPPSHLIEPARPATTCASCRRAIPELELVLAEAFVSDDGTWARSHKYARSAKPRDFEYEDDRSRQDSIHADLARRFHHLACAAIHQPYKLRSALAAAGDRIEQRAELERAIERSLRPLDVTEEDDATAAEYRAFIANIQASHHEDEALLVFGDWLQSKGDPRGELVAVQHALEVATGDRRADLLAQEKKLFASNRKRFLPEREVGNLVWRRGFVRRQVAMFSEPDALASAFASPSFRVVRELSIKLGGSSAASLAPMLPATLRALELAGDRIGAIGAIGHVPELERLALEGAYDLDGVEHPAVIELELACADATLPVGASVGAEPRPLVERIVALERSRLPKLARVILRIDRGLDRMVAALVDTRIMAKLHTLTLRGDLTRAALAHLAQVTLDVIDLRGCNNLADADLARLQAGRIVRDEVAPPPAPPKLVDWRVRHTRKPEWGIGRVTAEREDGLEVSFEHGGTKHVRNIELLEDVE